MNECKVQTGNSYTTSCQYFLGLPNPQSLSVCHEHCPFFFLSIAFGELYVNFEVTTSLQKSSKWKRSKHCKLSQLHWISSGSRLWAENFGQQLTVMRCMSQNRVTYNLIFTLQTFNYFEASCLVMDALCNFHGNQDISRVALQLCAILYPEVSPYSTHKT